MTLTNSRSMLFATAFVVFSACAVFAAPLNCSTIADEGFSVAAFFSGYPLKQTFNGTAVDLLGLYDSAIRNDNGTFNGQSSHLLLGYDNDVIVLPFTIGHVYEDNDEEESVKYFNPIKTALVDLTSLTVSKFDALGTTNDSILVAAFGKVDPSTVTLFQDVVFGNGKMFNITSKTFVDTIDERISYTPGSFFDLENPISVFGLNDSGTLIGVVSGKPIYREPCAHHQKTFFLVDCTKECQEAHFREEDFCFFMDGCKIAYGPKALFASIAVVPPVPVDYASLPPLSTKKPVISASKKPVISASKKHTTRSLPAITKKTFGRTKNPFPWRLMVASTFLVPIASAVILWLLLKYC